MLSGLFLLQHQLEVCPTYQVAVELLPKNELHTMSKMYGMAGACTHMNDTSTTKSHVHRQRQQHEGPWHQHTHEERLELCNRWQLQSSVHVFFFFCRSHCDSVTRGERLNPRYFRVEQVQA